MLCRVFTVLGAAVALLGLARPAAAVSLTDPALVAAYDFNASSGTVLADITGHGHAGALTDMEPSSDWVAGRAGAGNALDLDGTFEYVSIPDDNALDLTDAITVATWINLDTSSSYDRIVEKSAFSSWYFGLDVGTDPRRLAVWMNGASRATVPTDLLVYGTWAHVAFTYDRAAATNQIKIYIDGALQGTGTYSTAIGVDTADVRIGAHKADGNNLDGRVDDLSIWSRALSGTEIGELYAVGFTAVPEPGMGLGALVLAALALARPSRPGR